MCICFYILEYCTIVKFSPIIIACFILKRKKRRYIIQIIFIFSKCFSPFIVYLITSLGLWNSGLYTTKTKCCNRKVHFPGIHGSGTVSFRTVGDFSRKQTIYDLHKPNKSSFYIFSAIKLWRDFLHNVWIHVFWLPGTAIRLMTPLKYINIHNMRYMYIYSINVYIHIYILVIYVCINISINIYIHLLLTETGKWKL